MRKIWKTITGMVLCLTMIFGCFGNVRANAEQSAAEWPAGPTIETPSAIVMEASTGTVLYEKNADKQRYPASITKIMTTLLALENSSLDEIVTFSEDAVYKNEGNTSHIARDVGEQMTMEQCLYGIMLESANECSYAVAEHVGGGDYRKFIDMMNERAKQLGCTNTHFDNCNGLPDKKHRVSCRDMALIAREAIKNEEFRKITATAHYEIPPTNKHENPTLLNNHHQMICAYKTRKNLYEYCIGGKPGWTSDAKNTLVSYAEKDGMTLICVVMKCDAGVQYSDSRKLFEYCFDNYKMCNVSQNETRYSTGVSTGVSLFTQGEAFAALDTGAQIVLPKAAEFSDTETTVSYDRATADVIGTLVYSYGGRQVGTADVRTTGVTVNQYEFGKHAETSVKTDTSEEAGSENTETEGSETETKQAATKKNAVAGFLSSKDWNAKKIIVILIIIGAAIAVFFICVYLYNNFYRIWRRRRDRDRRYKTIKTNRKWDRRGRRRR